MRLCRPRRVSCGILLAMSAFEESQLPVIRGDGETSFTVRGIASRPFKKVLPMIEGAKSLIRGGHSRRLDIEVRVGWLGLVRFSVQGRRIAQADLDELPLVAAVPHKAFIARGYIWRSSETGDY